MTQLLVSVRSVVEARRALRGGAEVVDVKEPARGPLGAATPEVIAEIVRDSADCVPLSAACGELLDESFPLEQLPAGLAFAKLGLRGCAAVVDWQARLMAAWRRIPPGIDRVGVVYADWEACHAPPPHEVIQLSIRGGCRFILVDTHEKDGGDLFQLSLPSAIAAWCRAARAGGLGVAIAGSLTRDSFPDALALTPDLLAVRGAACHGSRGGAVSAGRVAALRRAIRVIDDRAPPPDKSSGGDLLDIHSAQLDT